MTTTRTYQGAWARRASQPTPLVPLVPGIDPQHLSPSPEANPGTPSWVQSDAAPSFPDGLTMEPYGVPVGGGGPLDMTPESHDFGPGVSPGFTQEQSREVMGAWHGQDLGAVASRQWQPTTDRWDGSGPHSAIISETPLDGDSPATIDYRYRTGVGAAGDGGNSRLGKRQKRWWDRFIDFHRYDVQMRPMYTVNAIGSREQPATPNPTHLDSPYPTPGPYYGTNDRFVGPQMRRTPVPWDQPIVTDASASPADGNFGLTSWGL